MNDGVGRVRQKGIVFFGQAEALRSQVPAKDVHAGIQVVEEFRKITGYEMRLEWGREMTELETRGWARLSDQRFRLTDQGLRFADAAAEMFLRP